MNTRPSKGHYRAIMGRAIDVDQSDANDSPPTPIDLLRPADWERYIGTASPATAALAAANHFTARPGQYLCLWDPEGRPRRVIFGLGDAGLMGLRALPSRLPEGTYRIDVAPYGFDPDRAAIAWALGTYRFDRYKSEPREPAPRLEMSGRDDRAWRVQADACAFARDIINTPANDMGPAELEAAAAAFAGAHAADLTVIRGDDLITCDYPAVHAVGRAAAPARAPRMVEIAWGDPAHPLLAIVGKGVMFDTGGLDLKPSTGMRWMKKDMGGAAHALALARMVTEYALPVRLCLLLPIVENAVAGDAMRPGDVLATRKGLSVEVGNTDAEGRLILADALARAAELEPDLTIDLATLTGAARVALGPDVSPFYTDDESLADALALASREEEDPLWRMPLWPGYASSIESDIADIKNDADAWAQAGSVTAALFLKRFAPTTGAWVHFDIFAWNGRSRPGWPQGAEAQAIRAIFAALRARYR